MCCVLSESDASTAATQLAPGTPGASADLEALTGLFAMLTHHLSTLEASQQAVSAALLQAADSCEGAA